MELKLHPKSDEPNDPHADYLLYSTCTGYILAEAMFHDDGKFSHFHESIFRGLHDICDYHYWAILSEDLK